MTDKSEKLTIHDVAREAGVAISTVSRVINGLDRVSPATRKKVKDAIQKLNFYPNSRAQALSSKKTGMIALLVPDFEGEYFTLLMEGAFEQAKASDLSLMVLKAHGPQAKIETLVRLREEERVDGAIMLLSEMSNGILDAIGGHYENLVVINKDIDHLRLDNVFIDNVAAGFEAVKHMIDVNGFERLIFVGGSTSSVDGFDRKQGFNNALADAGMEADMPVFYTGSFTYDAGFCLAQKSVVPIIKEGPRTGIIAANDHIACGVIDALTESGLKVPQDAGVIGFDDSMLAIRRNLKLTTMRMPVRQMGAAAVKMVISRLTEDSVRSAPSKLILRAELIVRQSCGCNQPDG